MKLEFEVRENGCHEVVSHKPAVNGYIQLCRKYDRDYAHRIVYREQVGEIPEGHCIRHKCDNRICVNPDHLETGTLQDNIQDRQDRNRQAKGESVGGSILKESQAIEIVALLETMRDKEIAKMYNVGKTTIFDIRHGRSWTHVTGFKKTRRNGESK